MKNFTLLFIISLALSVNTFAQSTALYSISLTTIWNEANHTSIHALIGSKKNIKMMLF